MFFLKTGFSVKKFRRYTSYLLIILIFILLNSSLALSLGDISKLNTSQRMNINNYLIDFVEEIYMNYSKENFQCIYNEIHPAIKEKLGRKEYIEFQEKNFEKYKLEISNIDVQRDVYSINLPEKYLDFNISNETVYKIRVKYDMKFSIGGSKETRQTEKDVIVFLDINHIYLLWDPSVITN